MYSQSDARRILVNHCFRVKIAAIHWNSPMHAMQISFNWRRRSQITFDTWQGIVYFKLYFISHTALSRLRFLSYYRPLNAHWLCGYQCDRATNQKPAKIVGRETDTRLILQFKMYFLPNHMASKAIYLRRQHLLNCHRSSVLSIKKVQLISLFRIVLFLALALCFENWNHLMHSHSFSSVNSVSFCLFIVGITFV